MIASSVAAVVVLAIVIPDAILQLDFVEHPTYQFEAAAQSIKRIVDADRTHSHLILSISGSDLTLMTGLPSIDDDFGTLDLDQRVAKYHPGWYIVWRYVVDPTHTFKPNRPVVVWRVDVVFLEESDWKYETSRAGSGRGGRTHTFGLIRPATKLAESAAYRLPRVGIRGGKPILIESSK